MRGSTATVRSLSMLIALLCASAAHPAAAKSAQGGLETLAQAALMGGSAEAAAATAQLRQAGEAGIEVVEVVEAMLAAAARCPAGGCDTEAAREALDRICGVRDCAEIRLFWHTDLEAAKAVAREQRKPILSLRLMGRLDEELSCANSRFFRTVFYKNQAIGELLRDRYVLHWHSVRPVPKVTIDFGDGSRLERTLTGNSIHYVLDSRGRLVDALPGLYGPEAFRRALLDAQRSARQAARLDDEQYQEWAYEHRIARRQALRNALIAEYGALGIPAYATTAPPAGLTADPTTAGLPDPPAPEPEPVAVVAAAAEEAEAPEIAEAAEPAAEESSVRDPWAALATTPGALVDRINVGGSETASKASGEQSLLAVLVSPDDPALRRMAERRRPSIRLDAASRDFLLRKHGVEDPAEAARLVDSFESTVALDEVINQYRMEPAIVERLILSSFGDPLDLEELNLWVYAEVFKTPLDDPWLGLAPDDVYVALPASTRTAATPVVPER